MINLTTEIRSRCFKEAEKIRLYRILKEPAEKKEKEIVDIFKEFLDNNVACNIIDPDLLELSQKLYCKRSTNHFIISPEAFGLDSFYQGIPNNLNCKTSLTFDYYSKYKCAINYGISNINISDNIIKVCTPEIIEQIKYFLYEVAKARFNVYYFGVGTFIKSDVYRGDYGAFRDLNTWGNLYNKDPKMFEMLYKISTGKEIEEEDKDVMEPEKKLLLELKSALGY